MSINVDTVASEDERSSMVLKYNRIMILGFTSVLDIWRHGPGAAPFNRYVVDYRVEFRGDVVVLAFRENNLPIVATNGEGTEDIVDVRCTAAIGEDSAFPASGKLLDLNATVVVV